MSASLDGIQRTLPVNGVKQRTYMACQSSGQSGLTNGIQTLEHFIDFISSQN